MPGRECRSFWGGASLALLCVTTVSACATAPAYVPPDPSAVGASGSYSTAQAGPTEDFAQWWELFEDPTLSALVTRSLTDNLDIGQAEARWRQARESYGQSRAGFWPSIGNSSRATATDQEIGPDTTVYGGGLDASWVVDLFGTVRGAVRAGSATQESAAFTLEDVRAAIAAEVARNYFDMLAARERIAFARSTLTTQTETLEIAGFRAQAGLVSALDVAQAEAQQAATAALIPTLERSEAQARYRLAVLTGQAPTALDAFLAESEALPAAPSEIAAGAPLDLLRRRADVRAAERRFAAAMARVGVARAQLYPSLTLSGGISSSAARLEDLNDLTVTSLVASLSQPLFQGGRLRAAVREREAAAEEALAAYKAKVLSALEDVENAVVAIGATQERLGRITTQVKAADTAATFARLQYQTGLIDFQRTLDAERSLLSAQSDLVATRNDAAQAAVRLFLALGGGWSVSTQTLTQAQDHGR